MLPTECDSNLRLEHLMARRKGNAVTFQTVPCMSSISNHNKNGEGVPKSRTYVPKRGTCRSNRDTDSKSVPCVMPCGCAHATSRRFPARASTPRLTATPTRAATTARLLRAPRATGRPCARHESRHQRRRRSFFFQVHEIAISDKCVGSCRSTVAPFWRSGASCAYSK